MSLDKAIRYGKEKRKPYRYSKVWDSSCRNNGGCPWCESNRLRQRRLLDVRAREEIREARSGTAV